MVMRTCQRKFILNKKALNNINIKILFFSFFILNGFLGQSIFKPATFNPSNGGLEPKEYKKGLSNISINGYYRFLGVYSNMKMQYPEMGNIKNSLFIGDDSNLPELNLTISVKPFKNTSISTDLYLWNPMTGSDEDYVKGLLLGLNLYGSHSTRYGTFGVKTGGIHWHKLSPLTFASNTGYNRYSLFERNPWDPNTRQIFERYETFYDNGALTQDIRWGQQAFHGFIFDGNDLPQDFSFSLMHGKSQLNGGTAPLPNMLTGGRIKKNIGDDFISINGVRNKTFSDSMSRFAVGFNIITSEFEINFGKKLATLYAEIGMGNYFSPNHNGKWGELMDIQLKLNKKLTHFPVEIRYFRISPNVINNNGAFWNTSIQEFTQNISQVDLGQAPLLFPFASSVLSIGQMTNNRQGVILNTDLKFGRNKFTIGYSAANEISALSNKITYGHPANNIALSRFWRWGFPSNVGPYGNISKIYRGVYETMLISDSITAKGFNTVEISYKTHFKILNRKVMLFYLGGFHSVQNSFSIAPKFSKNSYLQSYNHQLDLYYSISKNLAFCQYLGYDRIYGGNKTERNIDTDNPKNQEGFSYAFGFDILLAKNTGLYIRHRWMKYNDYSYEIDQYKGMETSVELKIFF